VLKEVYRGGGGKGAGPSIELKAFPVFKS